MMAKRAVNFVLVLLLVVGLWVKETEQACTSPVPNKSSLLLVHESVYTSSSHLDYYRDIGYCPCTDSTYIKLIQQEGLYPNVSRYQGLYPRLRTIQCNNPADLCVCTTPDYVNVLCWKPIVGDALTKVHILPYCDSSDPANVVCMNHVILECSSPTSTDGLRYVKDATKKRTCADQMDANGQYKWLLGKTATYLNAYSVSCGACPTTPVPIPCGEYTNPFVNNFPFAPTTVAPGR